MNIMRYLTLVLISIENPPYYSHLEIVYTCIAKLEGKYLNIEKIVSFGVIKVFNVSRFGCIETLKQLN